MKALEGRIALVTGASRGIGAAIAKRYAAEGAHVILVARTIGALEEVDDAIQAAGGTATLVPFDLREFDKIDEMGAHLFERFKRLDILVGNAGILGELTPVHHMAPDLWQEVFDTNVTANWRLLRSLDLLLREASDGRAIFVTSGVTQSTLPYWGPYTASKAALEAMVTAYAAENTKTAIKVNLVDPGIVRTAMRAKAFPGEDPIDHPHPDAITDIFVRLASPDCQQSGETLKATVRQPA